MQRPQQLADHRQREEGGVDPAVLADMVVDRAGQRDILAEDVAAGDVEMIDRRREIVIVEEGADACERLARRGTPGAGRHGLFRRRRGGRGGRGAAELWPHHAVSRAHRESVNDVIAISRDGSDASPCNTK
jgi:hypothetical protein